MTMQAARLRRPAGEQMRDRVLRGLTDYRPFATNGAVDLKSYLNKGAPLDWTANTGLVTRAVGPSSVLPDAAEFASASNQDLRRAVTDVDLSDINRPFCIAGWIYVTAYTQTFPSILGRWNATGPSQEWLLYGGQAATAIRFTISLDGTGTGTSDVTSGVMATGGWHFIVAGSFIAPKRQAFIRKDMGAYAFAAAIASGFVSNSQLYAGFNQNGTGSTNHFDGRLAHWGYWNRVPTETEQLWLYNGGAGRDLRAA